MAKEYLDKDGLAYFWTKIKSYVDSKISGGSGSTEAVRITTFKNNFKCYSDNGYNNQVWVRKVGKVVTLTGICGTTATITGTSTAVVMFTIPSGYRPPQELKVLCQGSGVSHWLLTVNTNGDVGHSRYDLGTNTTNSPSNTPSGAWLPFHVTWIID